MAGLNELAKHAGVSTGVVKKIFDGVVENIEKGGTVLIVGFGTFKARHRKERMCHNPQDPSKKVKVPAKTVLAFKPSSNLELNVKGK